MFYWMYPHLNFTDAPIVIWLNGGPGASSIFGNFLENGPLRIERNGTNSSTDYNVYINPEGSWVDSATMIYIDQPIGTGFSYGSPLLDNMEDATTYFMTFLENLWAMYPDFNKKPLFMTGESYAGKYIPVYSYEMLDTNVRIGSKKYNLKASLIGDPYIAPLTQRSHMYVVPQALNIIDNSNMDQVAALIKNCQEQILTGDYVNAEISCDGIMDYIYNISGGAYPYDNRIFNYDWDPNVETVNDYFTISSTHMDLYNAIHVYDSPKRPRFCMDCNRVSTALSADNLEDYTAYIVKLINIPSPVLIYAGEFDAQDGATGQEYWMKNLDFDDNDKLWLQPRKIYWLNATEVTTCVNFTTNATNYTNCTTDPSVNSNESQIVGGYWRSSPYFTYLTVSKAGHFVPTSNYLTSLQFLNDYIDVQNLTCHATGNNTCNVTGSMQAHMNNCSSNGMWNEARGSCICYSGFKFADCAVKTEFLDDGYNKTFNSAGPKWYSLSIEKFWTKSNLALNSTTPFDIYILKGTNKDPNPFDYDMSMRTVR